MRFLGLERPALKLLHSAETIKEGNLGAYNYWSSKTTAEIVDSLKPGAVDEAGQSISLLINEDGTILDGNTRALILQERGFDINKLPAEVHDIFGTEEDPQYGPEEPMGGFTPEDLGDG
jgi:hypothetical protein